MIMVREFILRRGSIPVSARGDLVAAVIKILCKCDHHKWDVLAAGKE
jgi:hypothetical protein